MVRGMCQWSYSGRKNKVNENDKNSEHLYCMIRCLKSKKADFDVKNEVPHYGGDAIEREDYYRNQNFRYFFSPLKIE